MTESKKNLSQSQSELANMLQTARKSEGLSTQQLSQVTKIPPLFIQELESAQFSSLPAAPYVRAFLQTLAKTLNLNYNHLLELYQPNPKPGPKEEAPPTPSSRSEQKQPKIIIILILAVLVIIFFLLIKSRNTQNDIQSINTTTSHEPLPEVEDFKTPYTDSMAPEIGTPYAQAQQDTLTAVSDDHPNDSALAKTIPPPQTQTTSRSFPTQLEIECISDTVWVGIRRVGNSNVQKLMTLGNTWKIFNKDSMHVKIGVASGVAVILRGERIHPATKRFSIFNGRIVYPRL